MTIEERKQLIQKKIALTEKNKAEALEENNARLKNAINTLNNLAKDVSELIELANYCKEQGIEFPSVSLSKPHRKEFIAYITSNTFGFIKACCILRPSSQLFTVN